LQDKFFEHMQEAGFTGFARGERGSTAENLSVLDYKIKQDEQKLADLTEQLSGVQVNYDNSQKTFMSFMEIDRSGKKTLTGKYTISAEDYQKLTTLAKESYSSASEVQKLRDENRNLSRRIWRLQDEVSDLRDELAELREKCKPYLEALKAAPKAIKAFIDDILEKFKRQEKDIIYKPTTPHIHPTERGKRFKDKDVER